MIAAVCILVPVLNFAVIRDDVPHLMAQLGSQLIWVDQQLAKQWSVYPW